MTRVTAVLGAAAAVVSVAAAPNAQAYPYIQCRTDHMSSQSYTYCSWQDPPGYWHRTTELCTNQHCTITGG